MTSTAPLTTPPAMPPDRGVCTHLPEACGLAARRQPQPLTDGAGPAAGAGRAGRLAAAARREQPCGAGRALAALGRGRGVGTAAAPARLQHGRRRAGTGAGQGLPGPRGLHRAVRHPDCAGGAAHRGTPSVRWRAAGGRAGLAWHLDRLFLAGGWPGPAGHGLAADPGAGARGHEGARRSVGRGQRVHRRARWRGGDRAPEQSAQAADAGAAARPVHRPHRRLVGAGRAGRCGAPACPRREVRHLGHLPCAGAGQAAAGRRHHPA